ncbi:hypothetical protein PB01_06245 [Psychrobacillus glaciei]|uniref:Uncharacterized protein n=1 Tax=Psychrobacillus glaciei TaxID=2283160 RepID=A0A5J6SKN7_9BACI|nr:hypothetical protein [Psychrobacillus glaciei]QFF98458.1 hypothetical protein PB01_06245 [Psychrobacillus glaciei]
MSFKIAILVCLILMGIIACITYYLAKKVSNSLMKYIPVFSFAMGALFFYMKFSFISYKPNSIEGIYDIIAIILLLIVCSIAFLEAVIIDIVENSNLFSRSYMAVRKVIQLVGINKAFKIKMPSDFVKKIRGL